MKIKRVIINNYGPFYGKHEFAVDARGLTLIMGDNQDDHRQNSNGAAKSSLLESMDWCFFGKVPREDAVDSIINDEAGKDCFVTAELEDDEHTPPRLIRITRFRKMNGKENGVSLAVDGKESTSLDSTETDRRIVDILGVDRDVFHALVFYQQGDRFNFADATDKERVDILTKVLQLDAIDQWAENFASRRNTVTVQLTEMDKVVVGETARRDALKQTDYAAAMAQWSANHSQQVQTQMATIDQLRVGAEQTRQVLTGYNVPALQQALEEARARLPQPDPAVLQKMAADKQTGMQTINGLREKLGGLTANESRVRGQIQHAEAKGGTCPTCNQPLPVTVTPEQQLATLRNEMVGITGQIEASRTLLQQWEGWVAGINTAERAHHESVKQAQQEHMGAVNAAASQLDTVRQAEAAVKMADAHHTLAVQELAKLQSQVNPYQEQQANLVQQVTAAEEAIKQATYNAEQCRIGLSYLEFWTDACGPKGIKSYVLDARLAELNEAINTQLNLLFGGILWARIETQTMGRSTGTLSNKINLRVFRHNPDGTTSERNFKSWSGGEKRRISLAVDMGLSQLIARRATKRYSVLILDEVFEHLDAAGRDAVMEMLHKLQAEKSSIFVIDHDAEFQGAFHSRVTVTKKNRRSTIAEREVKRGDQKEEEQGQDEAGGEVEVQGDGQAPQQRKKAAAPGKAAVRGNGGSNRKRRPAPDPIH